VILNDLVEALHRQIEDKTFITINLPLLIIREGTQREDVAPVRILAVSPLINLGTQHDGRSARAWMKRV
jgi:hypothetical protein